MTDGLIVHDGVLGTDLWRLLLRFGVVEMVVLAFRCVRRGDTLGHLGKEKVFVVSTGRGARDGTIPGATIRRIGERFLFNQPLNK